MNDPRSQRARLPVFTPTAVEAQELLTRTVGRGDVIARIVARITTAATSEDRPHVLVVGPRGSGKTHLLRVVVHEALQDEEVAEHVLVVTLPEDAPEVVSYPDLLFAVLERIAVRTKSIAGPLITSARQERRNANALEQLLLEALGERVLLLVIENLDRIFEDLGPEDQGRLRSFAETTGRVMILASTPLLFDAVSNHEKPWYGAFAPEQLDDLSSSDGAELLRRLAVFADNDVLAAFLETSRARARLEAVTHLAGGSPRIWMVLAGCLTIENLDELVPLVKALLDELVPYYQERLGSLGRNERKLVVELCRTSQIQADGSVQTVANGMRTATELAEACGLDRASATTSLNRLLASRWVRRRKLDGTDQRATWYEIREPMLRHHLQYRSAGSDNLQMIVGFLREWYSLTERRQHLASATPHSIAEEYLVDAIASDQLRITTARRYENRDPRELLADARTWLDDDRDGAPNRLAGIVAETIAVAVLSGDQAAAAALEQRIMASDPDSRDVFQRVADAARSRVEDLRPDADASQAVREGLFAAYDALPADSDVHGRAKLAVATANWVGEADSCKRSLDLLESLRSSALLAEDDSLRLALEDASAFLLRGAGDEETARRMAVDVLASRAQLLGPRHPDTLQTKRLLADWDAIDEHHADAIARYRELWSDLSASRGAADPDALETLLLAASEAAKVEDHAEVSNLLEDLVGNPMLLGSLQDLDRLVALSAWAAARAFLGDPEASIEPMREALKLIAKLFGEESEDMTPGLAFMAGILNEAGRVEEAAEVGREALLGALKEQPVNDPLVRSAYTTLARISMKVPDLDRALAIVLPPDGVPDPGAAFRFDVQLAERPWFWPVASLLLRNGSLAQLIERADTSALVRQTLAGAGPLATGIWSAQIAMLDLEMARTGVDWLRTHTEGERDGLIAVGIVQGASWIRKLPDPVRESWLAAWRERADETVEVALTMSEAIFALEDGDASATRNLPPELRDVLEAALKNELPPFLGVPSADSAAKRPV